MNISEELKDIHHGLLQAAGKIVWMLVKRRFRRAVLISLKADLEDTASRCDRLLTHISED